MQEIPKFPVLILRTTNRKLGPKRLAWWLSGKESAYQCKRHGFGPWVGKIPWRRKWQPTSALLPWKAHGQRSLACQCLWSCRVTHNLVTEQEYTPRKCPEYIPGWEAFNSQLLRVETPCWTLSVFIPSKILTHWIYYEGNVLCTHSSCYTCQTSLS